eukprot:9469929-Pyramimonas_sp.AAC.1
MSIERTGHTALRGACVICAPCRLPTCRDRVIFFGTDVALLRDAPSARSITRAQSTAVLLLRGGIDSFR